MRLNVIDRESGEVVSTISFSPSEQEMPGYVEHVIAGYEGTPWRAELAAEPPAPSETGPPEETVTERVLARQRNRGFQVERDAGTEPTNAEVDRLAQVLMAEWERVEGREVTASYVATFADMARAVLRNLQEAEVRDE